MKFLYIISLGITLKADVKLYLESYIGVFSCVYFEVIHFVLQPRHTLWVAALLSTKTISSTEMLNHSYHVTVVRFWDIRKTEKEL